MGSIQQFNKFKFKSFSKRIGNIAVINFYEQDGKKKPVQSHLKRPKFSFFEIVKFYPNPYYGKESEYELNSWGDGYRPKDSVGINISKSCFKNKEVMYMVASWDNIDHDELTPDLKFVGNRVFELDSEEREAFMKLAEIGQREIERQLNLNVKKLEL